MDLLSRLFLLSSVCVLVTYTAPANEEDGSEEVTIELYRVSVDDWNSKGKDIFVKYLIEEANRYCKDDLDSCMFEAFNSNDPFRTSNYEQTEGYPIKMKNFLNVKFALTLPPNINLKSSAPADYLNKEALATIAANTRGKVRDDTGWSIVTVGETDYELPPDNTLNIAISVAGCVILLALIIALVIMQHKCGRHPGAIKKKKRKKKSRSYKQGNQTEAVA